MIDRLLDFSSSRPRSTLVPSRRNIDTHFLDGSDDAFGDQIAAHDAAEDVDQNRLDVVIAENQLEGLGDALGGGAAAHVQEVGRFAPVELDDIHGRHGKTCAVDHAGNIAVQRHIVEIVLGRLRFQRIVLADIAHGFQPGLAEQRVIVAVELAIEGDQITRAVDDQRIQLDQAHVALIEQIEHGHHDLGQLGRLLGTQSHREPELAALESLQALHEVHFDREDLLGMVVGDLLDVDAAHGRRNEGHGTAGTVDQHAEVKLLADLGGLGDQHHVHGQGATAALVGLHPRTQHLGRRVAHLRERLDHLHATGLAAAAGMDLGLHHPLVATDLTGHFNSSVGGTGDRALWHGNAELYEQFLRLVLVEVHPVS